MTSYNKKINIITYHYVRNLNSKLFPDLKVLELNKFEKQIKYLKKKFEILSFEEINFLLKKNLKFPKNACWLTFDDGYSDHYKNVLPILKKNKIFGSFFPSVTYGNKKTLLDVNKIQIILATVSNYDLIITDLKKYILKYKSVSKIINYEKIYKKYFISNNFDNVKVSFIKRVLQYGLPLKLRKKIINKLYLKYIHFKETDLAKKFYISEKQIKKLQDNGMHIGGHGINHIRLSESNPDDQENEIKKTYDFLKSIGVNMNNWVMCYPYGQYNKDTIKILKRYNCYLGLTINKGVADFNSDNYLKLPRIDTNYI